MISYAKELASRRELLLACCAAERNELTMRGQILSEKLTVFDIGLSVFERLKKNPAWVAGIVVSLVVLKPRRLLDVLQTGLLAWQALRTVAPALNNIMGCRSEKKVAPSFYPS